MSKLTHFVLVFSTLSLLLNSYSFGQSAEQRKIPLKKMEKASITLSLQKATGIGPSGNVSIGIGDFDPNSDDERIKGYPKIKNEPAGLRNVVHYFFILDDFQYSYQSYLAGKYNKNYFLDRAREQKWNLADTLKLSKQPIKCGFSLMAGYTPDNEISYIIDRDVDGDYGNDVLMPALKRGNRNEDGAVEILTEYKTKLKIQQERILVRPTVEIRGKDGAEKIEVYFAFPEFKYARFNYQGEPYYLCTDAIGLGRKYIFVIPDAPNFDSAGSEAKVSINQFIHIGDEDLLFSGYENNGNQITLTVNNRNDISVTKQNALLKKSTANSQQNYTKISTQIGYMAPVIKGYNFLDSNTTNLSLISTGELRGKYVFVDFWSTFCGPCIAEFPYLKEVYKKYDRSKFEIIGILDERDASVTTRLAKEGNLIWPNIKTNTKGTELKGYNVNSYPTSYLIDPLGKIIAIDLRGEELANKLKTLIK
ncbi:MAG: TlpA family protein disulfide reductase [Pedobacter sp.]|nr:MAG: TlpA family protein disulfide reductase [Pedobacter sp.]